MKKLSYIILGSALLFTSCQKFLDRPDLNTMVDSEATYWRNENDLRLFANDFYPNYFVGYNSAWGTAYAPVIGYNFSDDLTSENQQLALLGSIPTDGGGSTSAAPATLRLEHPGPNWNFYWVRKANLMIDRIETFSKTKLTEDEYKHWSAVGRFFRGFEYSRLVSNFGDVPYFDKEVRPDDFETQYKDRTPRGEVMDKVYEDFKYVMSNMRESDGAGYVHRYAAAAMISNMMLFEGSWQQYHNLDKARAKKYLELARDAAQYVMDSGKYNFGSDFKSLFASENLAANPEVIFSRTYDDALTIRHSVASYSNGTENQVRSANLNLIQSFICNDGKIYQNSAVEDAKNFRLKELIKTRDPRFEATFMDTVNTPAVGTLVYAYKFAGREALTFLNSGKPYPAKWGSNTNTNDAPVARLAEVVLNWIEAKQILAENHGGAAVTQGDLDKSINAIRKRPLDKEAEGKGVKQTAALMLSALPSDPERDSDVSPLMWEIRRERRMEFVFEYARIQDIRRWKKLTYLNFEKDSYKLGSWVIGLKDFRDKNNPGKILASYKNRLQVKKADGTIVTYDGTNDAEMEGFYVVRNFTNRLPVLDKNYLAPVSVALIQAYQDKGYKLTQTPGW
ncbi:RagB/SusD family nutrient uptake outer membrane protein [Sphingobacterium cellulitidis]|uniref:RagB/SusD family nutrient uptake outer membrane protein n=1 Tax=Sphingobacterium cellulitidis TaxID=1768011 RepID=UPI000B9427BD|nr:RagB/SusD family nutrient uptake outer membrane protein [Sphingobacterium cellulitidis]OYD41603.1 RagB/SusD family nutrient uptake outer membrane protein [Sphingobacterium cellulitidis]OYD45748.1 RagB/SusD family nutrient uptake outer membrane protein [Sphingobacterium cellulitidis]